jgi:OFA family oxalate/formate antiporter-like MFS transporter
MNRWLSLLGALLVIPCLGAVYAWSIYQGPLQEVFAQKMGVTPEGLQLPISMVFSATILVFAITAYFGGRLQDKIGPQRVTIMGGVLLGLGLILSSQATSIAYLYLFYGIISGTGLGFAYITPLATCNKWFPDKKGLISGVVVAGMGLGSLVFTPVGRAMVLSRGVMSTWLILGFVFMALVCTGSLFLKLPPAGYRPPGWEPSMAGNQASANFTQREMLATPAFYGLWLMFLVGSAAGLMVIGLASSIGQQIAGLTSSEAAAVVSMLGIFNGAGRILWGALSDRIGRMRTLAALFLITAAAMASFTVVSSMVPFAIAISTVTLCFGGYLALFPATTAEFYGIQNLGGNYGLVYIAYGVGAPVGMYLGTSLTIQAAFLSSAILCLVAAGIALITKPPQKEAAATLQMA